MKFMKQIGRGFLLTRKDKSAWIPSDFRILLAAFNTVSLIIFIFVQNTGEAAESDCLNKLLEDQYSKIDDMPEIKFVPGTYWFKKDSTVLEEPPNDIKFSPKQPSLKNHSVTYFFDLNDSKEYIQNRGGLNDYVYWYGPISISQDARSCLMLIKGSH